MLITIDPHKEEFLSLSRQVEFFNHELSPVYFIQEEPPFEIVCKYSALVPEARSIISATRNVINRLLFCTQAQFHVEIDITRALIGRIEIFIRRILRWGDDNEGPYAFDDSPDKPPSSKKPNSVTAA